MPSPLRRPTLALTKTLVPAAPVPGQAVTYTLTVTSDGPSTATDAVVTDQLSTAVSDLTTTSTRGTCATDDTNRLTCTLGPMAPGDTVTVTVSGLLSSGFTGTLSNNATVGSPTPDPEVDDNVAGVDGVSVPSADLAITKRVTPLAPVPGATVTYVLDVHNDGPSAATSVTVTDQIADTLLGASAQPSTGTCSVDSAGLLSCELGTLPPGADASITVTATVAPDATGALSNTATVASATDDPDPVNNTATVAGDLEPSADLSIAKVLSSGTPVPGQPVTYTITVDNAGPSTASAVTVRDALDPSLADAAVTTTAGTCTVGGDGVVVCALGALGPDDAAVTITVTATLDPAATAALTNTATVSSSTQDPDPTDNDATVTTPVAPSADVSITKTLAPATPVPGETVTFTLTIANVGPSSAADVRVADVLSDSLLDPEVGSSAGTCMIVDGTLGCELGTLAPAGDPVVITVTAVLTPGQTDPVSNTATVASDTPDPRADNNTATAAAGSAPSADVSVVKTVSPAAPVAGGRVAFTLVVRNAGPSTATAVRVDDRLDASLTDVTVSSTVGACSAPGGAVTCALGDLAPEATVTITVDATLATTFTGELVNIATVNSPTSDPDTTNNTSTATADTEASADLAVTKTLAPAAPTPGAPVTYTITVDNLGPSAATEVVVTDALDGSLLEPVVTSSRGTCALGPDRVVVCQLGTLDAADALVIITVTARVAPDATTEIVNTATVASGTPDPVAANNTATVGATPTPAADVSIVKTVSPDPVVAGERVTWTLTVLNAGPSIATAVTVTDALPSGLSGATASASVGTCEIVEPEGELLCALGALASGSTATVSVSADLAAGASGELTNTAAVGSGVPDPDESNNTDTVTVRVVGDTDVSLTKTASKATAVVGDRITYTLVVANAGPSVADGVVVVDSLPAGLRPVGTAISEVGSCTSSGQTTTCRLGNVGPGQSITVRVVAQVLDTAAGGSVTNRATVTTAANDRDPANDADSATVVVADVAPPTPPTPPVPPEPGHPKPPPGGPGLPITGVNLLPTLGLGLSAVLAGLLIIWLARRGAPREASPSSGRGRSGSSTGPPRP